MFFVNNSVAVKPVVAWVFTSVHGLLLFSCTPLPVSMLLYAVGLSGLSGIKEGGIVS